MLISAVVSRLNTFQRISEVYNKLSETQKIQEKLRYDKALNDLDTACEAYLTEKLIVIDKKKSKK